MLSLEEVRDHIRAEEAEDADYIHLTSNETRLSPLAASVLASPLGNRYLLEHGDTRQDSPSRLNGFLYRGLDHVNAIERSATEVCRELFGAEQVEFRCLSGLHAMQTTMVALTRPGDAVMRFGVADGGHFATENIIKLFGRRSCCYAFDRARLTIDLEGTAEIVRRERPALLYLDAMNYLFPFPIRELRRIVGDTPILYDASHTLGLIAGGQFQQPLDEGADILQANTHKTFFGPQKGIILGRNRELMERVSYSLSQGLVSSQHTASSLALFVALHEMQRYGRAYARAVIDNAQLLARAMQEQGLPVLLRDDGAATKNHHFFIDLAGVTSASHAMEALLRAHLVVNRTIPFRNVDALRVGVAEATRRGYQTEDLRQIAAWFGDIVLRGAAPEEIAPQVAALARRRQDVLYCDLADAEPAPAESAAAAVESAAATPTGRVWSKAGTSRARERWINFARLGPDAPLQEEQLLEMRALGQMAASFPDQTDSTGNLSRRDGDTIRVTTSGCYIKHLEQRHFVQAVGYDDGLMTYLGNGIPSSESLLHYLIYERTDANLVVHMHVLLSNREAQDLDVVIVPPLEYGSVQLARAVADACQKRPIIYVQRHGLVIHGRDGASCREQMEQFIRHRLELRA